MKYVLSLFVFVACLAAVFAAPTPDHYKRLDASVQVEHTDDGYNEVSYAYLNILEDTSSDSDDYFQYIDPNGGQLIGVDFAATS